MLQRFHFLLLLFIFPLSAKAQTLDTELWLDITGKYELTKKIDAGMELGYRRDENFSRAKILYFEPEIVAEPFKDFEVGLLFRFSVLPNDVPDTERRLALTLQYKWDIGKFDLSYRFRYQEDYIPESNKVPQLRNRLKLDYNLSKKFDPFFATELFYDNQPTQKEFEQLRFQLGGEIDLPKGHDLKVYYMLRNRFNVGTPGNVHVVGMTFSL